MKAPRWIVVLIVTTYMLVWWPWVVVWFQPLEHWLRAIGLRPSVAIPCVYATWAAGLALSVISGVMLARAKRYGSSSWWFLLLLVAAPIVWIGYVAAGNVYLILRFSP